MTSFICRVGKGITCFGARVLNRASSELLNAVADGNDLGHSPPAKSLFGSFGETTSNQGIG